MAVATLPTSFVLSAVSSNILKYIQYQHEDMETHGFFKAAGDNIHCPFSKLEVVEAGGGRVHIRCSYNNKFLAIRKEGESVIAAVADKPVEDESEWSCTMFQPLQVPEDATGREIRLLHVQLGRNLFMDHVNFLNVEAEADAEADSMTRFVFSDLASRVILPRFVAFVMDNGNYLTPRYPPISPGRVPILHCDDPNLNKWHPHVLHEVVPESRSGEVRLRCHFLDRFWIRRTHAMLLVDGLISDTTENSSFMPVLVTNNNNQLIVSFHTSVDGRRYHLLIAPPQTGVLIASNPLASPVTPAARMVVEEAVRFKDMFNVRFNLVDARILSGIPQSMDSHSFTNRTSLQQTMERTFTRTTSTTNTWNATASTSLTVAARFRAGIPFLARGEISVSVEVSGSFEWGKESTVEETVSDTVTIDVPPMSFVIVHRLETRGTCDVPFSYTQEYTLGTGERRSFNMDDGLFTGVNSFDIHYEAIEEGLVPSSSTTNQPRVYQVFPKSSA